MDLKDLWTKILISPHPSINFEILNYHQNEPKFNGVYSRDNIPDKVKDGAFVINFDKYSDIGTHWIALYALNNNVTYFDSFLVGHIPKKTNNLLLNLWLMNLLLQQIFIEYKHMIQ